MIPPAPLPFDVKIESDSISLKPGETKHFNLIISPESENNIGVSLISTTTHDFLDVSLTHDTPETFQLDKDSPRPIHTNISAAEDAMPGTYKILLGGQTSDVAVSKFITVTIE